MMVPKATVGRISPPATRNRRMRRRAVHAWFTVIGTFLTCVAASSAQVEEDKKPFRLSPMDTAATYQRLTVPFNRSVIVEATVAVSRVDVVASGVVEINPISPTQLLVTGKNYGTTNVVVWDDKDQQYIFEVTVELDVVALQETIASIDPQATVEARSLLGNIVLTGTVSSAKHAARIAEVAALFMPSAGSGSETVVQNHLNVAGEQQVRLHCVVAEVSRSGVRQLGINGFLAGENFRDMFMINQIGGINPISMGIPGGAAVTQNLPFLVGDGGVPVGGTSTLSLGFPRAQMQLFVRAMADNSLLKILAEPNLVAISGETASFLAGGEFPVPVPQGNQQVTIEFREFGVRLNFTPVVRGHQTIRLHVNPEVSELDFSNAVQFQGLTVPGLTTRSTDTTVEVGSGQTIVIAGLLSEQMNGIATRVPGLGDIPVLGSLFRSVDFRRSMTELVILVTPEIVAPLDAHQTAWLPGEEVNPPSDWELYLFGGIEARPTVSADGTMVKDTTPSPQPENLSIHGPWGHAGG